MKIAFISYEYPPDTGFGGIATYTWHAARMLSGRGHCVEVFAGSCSRSESRIEDGLRVHRVNEPNLAKAHSLMAGLFARRHREVRFDVLESAELDAEARDAVRLVPEIPFVIRLHSPSLLLWCHNSPNGYITHSLNTLYVYLRGLLSGLKPSLRGALLRPHPHFLNHASTIADNQRERALAATADQFVSPSRALIQKISKVWDLDPKEIWHIPNPYSGSSQLLEIPLNTKTRVVTFIGRMEINKGVIDLARAIPLILHRYPDTRFRFVGDNFYSPLRGIDMQQYLTYFILNSCRHAVQFEGRVPVDRIPEILASTDICVFPSLWDNFPYVCLEAMAAGRGIVATKSGGMAEMLDGGGVGRLVASQMPSEIAQAVCELLQYPYLRMQLGEAARNRVMTEYTEARICPLFEELYASAIRRR